MNVPDKYRHYSVSLYRDFGELMTRTIFILVIFTALIDFLIGIVCSIETAIVFFPVVLLLSTIASVNLDGALFDSKMEKTINRHINPNEKGFHKPDWTYESVAYMCLGTHIPIGMTNKYKFIPMYTQIGQNKYKLAVPEEEARGDYKRVCDVCGLIERKEAFYIKFCL